MRARFFLTLILFLSSLHQPMVAARFRTQGNPDQLLEWFIETGSPEYAEKIRSDYPGSPHEMFCNAWEYLGANNEKSRELAEKMVSKHPNFVPGYLALGTVLSEGFGEYTGAVDQLSRGIEIAPEFVPTILYRGIARIGLEDYDGAKEDFNRVLNLKRGHARARILRGIANYRLGEEEAMKADFEIGLQLDFRILSTIPGDMADDAIGKAIESAPENALYFYARGYSYFTRGSYRLARADFTRCIELVPGSSDFYKYSGASKMNLDDYEGGQKDLNYALSINPDDPETYYYLGVLMNDFLDQPAMALEYMDLAIGLDESIAAYYYERAKAAYQMMNYREARDDVNLALQKDHTVGDYYALRGNIKMKTGRSSDDYCPDFHKAIEWGTTQNLKRILKKNCR
jgi:tetratricopeptide (TPR) repeat protein